MNILLIDTGSRSLEHLTDALKEHVVTIMRLEEFDMSSTLPDRTELIVLSGSSQYTVINNEHRFSHIRDLILTSPLPILGICLGCELIAHTFGAPLTELESKSVGVRTLTITDPDDPLFENHPPLQVYESHHFAITSLPPTLRGIARSDSGFEIIRHASLPRLGFQFHPESTTHTSGGPTLLREALRTCTK